MPSTSDEDDVHDLPEGRNALEGEAHNHKDVNALADASDHKDGDALEENTLRLNPEIMRGVPPLPDLDQIEVMLARPAPRLGVRWAEGLGIHVVGSGIVAVIAFAAGLLLAGPAIQAASAPRTGQCPSAADSAPPFIAE